MNTATLDRPAIEPTTALTLPQRAAVALNTATYEISLRELVQSSCRIVAITNKAGREECHSAAMSLTRTLVDIDKTGKLAREDANAFRDAVIAEVKRLVAIGAPEKERLLSLRDTFDAAEQARKDALIKAERERTEAIEAAIQAIREIPISMAGKSSQDIGHCIVGLVGTIPDEFYQEFIERAQAARHEALDKLAAMETAQRGVEIEAESQRQEAARVAAEAEQARIAEIARIAADRAEHERLAEIERAEMTRIRAENERIANEQAAERQRLADLAAAQELAAKQLREKAEANLKAERDAQAEQMRIERERVNAEQLKAAADLKAAIEAHALEVAAHAAKLRVDIDHAEALNDNAMFDAAIVACERFPEVLAEQMAEEAEINGRSLVQPESYSERDAMIDAADGMDAEPTDIEIIDVYVENFGGTRPQAVARLLAFVGDEA